MKRERLTNRQADRADGRVNIKGELEEYRNAMAGMMANISKADGWSDGNIELLRDCCQSGLMCIQGAVS